MNGDHTTPLTEFVLVRDKRVDGAVKVRIVRNDGSFDFADYCFLRMSTASAAPVEEWVHVDELEMYKAVMVLDTDK